MEAEADEDTQVEFGVLELDYPPHHPVRIVREIYERALADVGASWCEAIGCRCNHGWRGDDDRDLWDD